MDQMKIAQPERKQRKKDQLLNGFLLLVLVLLVNLFLYIIMPAVFRVFY
jgi:hypothetical protein